MHSKNVNGKITEEWHKITDEVATNFAKYGKPYLKQELD